jgi:hypothetical protein
MVLSHLYVEGQAVPYRTPLRSLSTREVDGRRSGSTALTTAIVPAAQSALRLATRLDRYAGLFFVIHAGGHAPPTLGVIASEHPMG